MFVEVALPIPRLKPLTYCITDHMHLAPGMRVTVPLGRRAVIGVAVAVNERLQESISPVKSVINVLDQEPALSSELLKLGKWIAEYYQCTWGEALHAMLPSYTPLKLVERFRLQNPMPETSPPRGIAREILGRLAEGPKLRSELLQDLSAGAARALKTLETRGFIIADRITEYFTPPVLPTNNICPQDTPPTLTMHQASAFAAIQSALSRREYTTFLLHGVTGSGKTEVYLRAIAQALKQQQGAILLVPEISLTPQTRARIAARFGAQVEVFHSALTLKERSAAWHRLRKGVSQVVLGARSAIFAPVQNLGLIIVDEEYEGSYKQEEVPRYHARDIAVVRARAEKAVLVLGSATPSVETYYNVQQRRYRLLELPERVDGKRLPEFRVVDMSQEISLYGHTPIFSQILLQELEKRLQAREQSILFLNRRGFAPLVMCPVCRHVLTCSDCSVSLVYHQQSDRLLCHSCGRAFAPRPACPKCGAACVRLAGVGTQRVEVELKKFFPQARILRIDQDTSRKRGVLEQMLERFGQGKGDILVGTQMVAKGIDFPGVTLVGIISTDTALYLPDFRAEERTFQLLVQVAGRAGRGGRPGLVLAQTLNSSQPIIALAQAQNYHDFFARELVQRQDLYYPPFARLANVICQGQNRSLVIKVAESVAATLKKAASNKDFVLGPVPSPRERIARESRFQILIKSPNHSARMRILKSLQLVKPVSGIRLIVDVDPQNML